MILFEGKGWLCKQTLISILERADLNTFISELCISYYADNWQSKRVVYTVCGEDLLTNREDK